jgi:hypothetical protein
MISFRLAVPAVFAACAVAGCFTYFVTAPVLIEADKRSAPAASNLVGSDNKASTGIDQPATAEEEAAKKAYREAADAILRRLPNAQASAGADEPPITGRIPLPKRRPMAAP